MNSAILVGGLGYMLGAAICGLVKKEKKTMTKIERAAVAFIEVICEQLQRSEKRADEFEQKLHEEILKRSKAEHDNGALRSEINTLRTANEEQAKRLGEQQMQISSLMPTTRSRRGR